MMTRAGKRKKKSRSVYEERMTILSACSQRGDDNGRHREKGVLLKLGSKTEGDQVRTESLPSAGQKIFLQVSWEVFTVEREA